ncbi:hypothetical protein A8950_3863 [Dongia mobilis]|uniref:Uncharacterized protein n=1 Tax=Dongia mobilis TaxID=578943 RepID=A0A4R6WIJ1_9PROT|nr:hypothetical protein [Dongia mobilis]TDQ77708.1 hypothetical protein A8950_3863 [Dongia mobilis]
MPCLEPIRAGLAALLLVLPFGAAAQESSGQETAAWERSQSGEVEFADLPLDGKGRFTAFCRMTSAGPVAGLALFAPQFQTLVINRQHYGLIIVVDGVRENFHMEARDIELWFEARDLNQQTTLARFFDTLPNAQRIDFAISSLGWRENRHAENGAVLAGLMDNCL